MNARQIKAYNELMDYVEREDKSYKDLMRNKKGHFDFFPKFGSTHRIRVLDFDTHINAKVKQVVKINQLTRSEACELEAFFKRSSLHVTESSLLDLYLPHFLSMLGISFLLILFYALTIQSCSIDLAKEELQECLKKGMFTLQVFNYLVGIIIAVFIWIAVKRRSMLLVIANLKSLLSEHVKKIAETLPENK